MKQEFQYSFTLQLLLLLQLSGDRIISVNSVMVATLFS